MAKRIEIDVDIDSVTGEVKIDAIGFTGKACEEIHNKLSEALGGVVLEQSDKPEKRERPVEKVSFNQSGS